MCLQTNTSLTIETKFMRWWEFDNIMQAVGCMRSWFSGTYHVQNLLREYLRSTVGNSFNHVILGEEVFYDAEEELSDEETPCFYDIAVDSMLPCTVAMGYGADSVVAENDIDVLHTPPPLDVPYKRRKVTRSNSSGIEVGIYSEETPKTPKGIAEPLDHWESFFSFIWIIIGSSCNFVSSVAEIILSPTWFVLSLVWTIVLSIMLPVFWICWEIMYAPVRLALALASFVVFACSLVYEMLGELWSTLYSVFCIASATEATVTTATTFEVSMWRSLWNDLFSKVFRAVRSILNGFVDFFATCNRHRLRLALCLLFCFTVS
ncbi:hypothetical protein Cgig2_026823 [Carnegiea gigantea]|uniref:Transmembrane protein n=1 Tax=Carnegiea gigantea TaxID=171969 RepID=A0A9Q1JYV4_9CARY|nr:hypothetical protein Cgig2_026823 [Carnegiea gigantea]